MIPEYVNQSGFAGLLAVLGVASSLFIAAAITHLVIALSINYSRRKDRDALGAQLLKASRGPVVLFLVTLGVFLAYLLLTKLSHPSFDFFDGHESWAVKVWLVITLGEVSYLGSQIVQALVRWYVNRIPEQSTSNLNDRLLAQARWFTPVFIYSVGVLMALDVVGIAVTPLIAGLGIGGIAVALALQPTLSNVFSGAFMLTEGELNKGDFIELEGGPSGFVVEVSWRSTKIRDRFNNLIMIPNTKMMESVMTNYYSDSRVMTVIVQCGVSYDSDLEQVEAVALEVAAGVRDDIEAAIEDFDPAVRFTTFGESNIDFVVVMQAEDRQGTFVVKHELIKRLRNRFDREGIEINYPVRKLLVPNPEDVLGSPPKDSIEAS